MTNVIDFASVAAAKAATKPSVTAAPFDPSESAVEKLAGLAGQLAANVLALEQTVARNSADIAALAEANQMLVAIVMKHCQGGFGASA